MQSSDFIRPLGGLRGIAALMVAVAHMSDMTGVPGTGLSAGLGVVLFFILSGFLMAHLYLQRPISVINVVGFVLARFGRVYPLFAVVVVGAGVLSLVLPDGVAPYWLKYEDIAPHLMLYGEGTTIWTIAVEFHFYGIFLVFWILTGFLQGTARDVAFGLIAMAIILFCWWLGVSEGRNTLWRYLHVFFCGALAAVVLRHNRDLIERVAPWLLPLALIYFALSYILIPLHDPTQVYAVLPIVIAVTCTVIFAAAAPASPVARILGSMPLLFLGEISYGVYLLHRWVMLFWGMLFGDAIQGWPLLLILLILTIAMATATYFTIERPFRSLFRAIARRLPGASQVATMPVRPV